MNNYMFPQPIVMQPDQLPFIWDQVVSNYPKQIHWQYGAPWKHSLFLNLPPTETTLDFPYSAKPNFRGYFGEQTHAICICAHLLHTSEH